MQPDKGNGHDLRFFYVLAAALIMTAFVGVIVGLLSTKLPSPGPEIGNGRSEQTPESSEPPESPVADPGIDFAPVVTGLDMPVYLTHAEDDSGRLFIVEQTGRVLVMEDDGHGPQVYLDLSDRVRAQGEQGLLSIAFHPFFIANGLLYVSYTGVDGDSVIARYTVDPPSGGRPDPDSATVLLTVPQPYANHNGGLIAFGPDGYLYVGLGDGGSGGDPDGNAQNPETLLGSLLRLDVGGGGDTGGGSDSLIPPDNPFVDGPGRGELWAIGLRNPWRFSFDRATGDLYIGDVGQSTREEINFQPANSRGGENYGWNVWEGSTRYSDGDPVSDVTWPVVEYETGSEGCAVTGGYVYRGTAIPALQGIYLYSDYCSGTLYGLVRNGERWRHAPIMPTGLRVSSFGEDEAGELYLVDHDGGIYRLIPGSTPIPDELLVNSQD